eukprot:6254862-Karenia_brevis.AAC.1
MHHPPPDLINARFFHRAQPPEGSNASRPLVNVSKPTVTVDGGLALKEACKQYGFKHYSVSHTDRQFDKRVHRGPKGILEIKTQRTDSLFGWSKHYVPSQLATRTPAA